MPDFAAISAVITAVKNLIDGVTGLTGSLNGNGTLDTVGAFLGSLGADEVVTD